MNHLMKDKFQYLLENSRITAPVDIWYFSALCYLTLPLLLFLAFFVKFIFAIPAGLFILTCLYKIRKNIVWRPVPWPTTLLLLVFALFILFLAGMFPPLALNTDWGKHFALLDILIKRPWPVLDVTPSGISAMRYYLGWYLVPAGICKILGKGWVDASITLWSLCGLWLFFVLLADNFFDLSRKWMALAIAMIFVFFSGADTIGDALTGAKLVAPQHYEWWATYYEYSANLTTIIWVPQHGIAGWLGVALLLNRKMASEWVLSYAGLLIGAMCFWSPFVAMGILPFLLTTAGFRYWRKLLSIPNMACLVFLAPLLIGYLLSGSAKIPRGWIFDTGGNWSWLQLAGFELLEFGIFALVLGALGLKRPAIYWTTVITLILIPLVHVGMANDFAMRGAIPALAVLAIMTAEALLTLPWRKALPLALVFSMGLGNCWYEASRGFLFDRQEIVPSEIAAILNPIRPYYAQYFVTYPNFFLR